ncbi:MAG: hypothetical protein R3200_05955 [Xanthomonadales bacterium]|nr:hypothetical protein [Xanthomonadales bacterium]
MKALGMILLIIGFLAGAYVASLDAEATNWTWFLPAIGVAVAGLLAHRRATHAAAKSDDVLIGNRQTLEESLDRIVQELDALKSHKEEIPCYEMRFEIDKRFRNDLIKFADARETMSHLFGLQAYADIMSSFAAGERYLNRVWSASTDGYAQEVLDYVDKAHHQFLEAREQFYAAADKAGA